MPTVMGRAPRGAAARARRSSPAARSRPMAPRGRPDSGTDPEFSSRLKRSSSSSRAGSSAASRTASFTGAGRASPSTSPISTSTPIEGGPAPKPGRSTRAPSADRPSRQRSAKRRRSRAGNSSCVISSPTVPLSGSGADPVARRVRRGVERTGAPATSPSHLNAADARSLGAGELRYASARGRKVLLATVLGVGDGVPGRDGGQRRPAEHRRGPRRRSLGAPVDGQRLRADARRPAPDRRVARGPPRPPADLLGRRGLVRRRVAALRDRADDRDADRRPRDPGGRRGAAHPRQPRAARGELPQGRPRRPRSGPGRASRASRPPSARSSAGGSSRWRRGG